MKKHLLLIFLLWGSVLATRAQAPPVFNLGKVIGTPVGFPNDVAVDQAGFMYLLDGAAITKLTPAGVYVNRFVLTSNVAGYYGLDVDGAGNLYVCNYTLSRIEKYSPTGTLLLQFGLQGTAPGQFQNPNSLKVDAAGNIYVVDTVNNRLEKFDTNGNLLYVYTGTAPNALFHPMDVTLDANGTVYVFNENFYVTKLTPSGTRLQTFLLPASQVSYDEATSIAVDPAGNIYATSFRGYAILKFTAAGTYVSTIGTNDFGGTHTPIAIDAAGNIFASNRDHSGNSKLYKYNNAGTRLNRWGNLSTYSGLVLDAVGNYYFHDPQAGAIKKYSASHQLLTTYGSSLINVYAMAVDVLGNVYALQTSPAGAGIMKFAPDGRQLNTFTNLGGNINYNSSGNGLAVDAAGNMYVTDYYAGCVRKIGPQGQLLPAIGTSGYGLGQLRLPQAVAVDVRGYVYVADNVGRRVQRFTPNGQVVREYGVRASQGASVPQCTVSLAVDGAGNAYVSTSITAGLQRFDSRTGSVTAMPSINRGEVAVDRRASRLVTMVGDLIRFYESDTVEPENLITGTVYEDLNGNCVRDANEPALPNIAVVAEPGSYYGLSNANGQYAIAVDTGAYTVHQELPTHEVGRTIAQGCASPYTLRFVGHGNSLSGPDFADQVSTAPYLRVSVGSTRRRRCFRNTTTVSYANTGFAPAPNAVVTVTLPQYVVFISANAPHTRDAQGNYLFQVGTLAPQTSGTLVIQDSVACGNPAIRGLTVCTRASITPPNTYPAPPTWNRASVTVQGRVQPGNQVRFVLRNTATTAMTDSLPFRLYQNTDLALLHHYQLGAGDSLVLRVPATRPVVRLEADQPTGHPTQRVASSTVEVAALGSAGQPNPAMTASPPNQPGPETAEDCLPIIDSFDPNDKQVTPTGTTAQHYTPTGVPLSYQIRFQNTGTDDAYRVEVTDTLAADLDLRTLRVGAASHPYRLAVAGHGRPVLTFTFDNINLPPSTRDAAGSNGFVQFSIQPKAGLPARALVQNNADIFFDYNPPIRTNTTTNRIYDVPAVVEPAVAQPYANVLASPVLTQLSPAQGRAGTLVTLSGQRFAATAAANTVRFNGVAAPVLSATATTLTVRVPAGASTGPVQVVTGEGAGRSAQAFTVYQAPTLAPLAPAEGVPGAVVTITGTAFSAVAAQDTVRFNGLLATVQQATATTLRVVVPMSATTGKIQVNTLGGQVQSTQDFVVWYPPTLLSFSPSRGKAGDLVTLTGTNFAPAARNAVAFGAGAGAVVQATGSSLQVRVPADAQSGPLRVGTPGGSAVSAAGFTFLPAPHISTFAPAQASVGDVVTLTGLNFLVDNQPDTVYFNQTKAVVLSATATSATVRVPKGAASGPLTMAGVGGRHASSTPFTLLDLSAAEAITTYPNPTRGAVTLDWTRADFEVEQVRVYNAVGSLVASQDLRHAPSPTLVLPFAPGQAGLYLLVVQTSRGAVLKRVTVIN
ncbi:IPT/TIG domain-containing protein [Hymenobacter monticola]|uniref:IPT/TIG domain-containing protein n=1 Tax=Hymenobacter monticola TaxID=1705399 RepID=A0ABY4BES3_9BACT|nr:IPT/TIG domain-containing protein [Hymenobacter monticola]UOE36268.1 IPT/TIG domain-containing protein [Hymenobacter monticola]